MMCTPSQPNAFATNNSGGGQGLYTSLPWADTSTFPNMSYQAQPGQYGQYQTPPWITSGLQAANNPISNYPITNYGRWNYGGGNTNGYGMSASPWPTAQSITNPYGGQQWSPNSQGGSMLPGPYGSGPVYGTPGYIVDPGYAGGSGPMPTSTPPSI